MFKAAEQSSKQVWRGVEEDLTVSSPKEPDDQVVPTTDLTSMWSWYVAIAAE